MNFSQVLMFSLISIFLDKCNNQELSKKQISFWGPILYFWKFWNHSLTSRAHDGGDSLLYKTIQYKTTVTATVFWWYEWMADSLYMAFKCCWCKIQQSCGQQVSSYTYGCILNIGNLLFVLKCCLFTLVIWEQQRKNCPGSFVTAWWIKMFLNIYYQFSRARHFQID